MNKTQNSLRVTWDLETSPEKHCSEVSTFIQFREIKVKAAKYKDKESGNFFNPCKIKFFQVFQVDIRSRNTGGPNSSDNALVVKD